MFHNIDNYAEVKANIGVEKVNYIKRTLESNDRCLHSMDSKYGGNNSSIILPFC